MVFKKLANMNFKKKEKKVEKFKPKADDVLFRLIKNRRSIRKYKKQPVPYGHIEKMLLSAREAPSSGNIQPWEFIVVTDEKMRREIAEASFGQYWMMDAPVFIIACINNRLASSVYGERGSKLYAIQSVSVAAENMILMGEALGLGSCWVGSFSEPRVSTLLHCQTYIRPCIILTFGYPNEEPEAPGRQPLIEIVHYEVFGQTERFKRSDIH